jgi:hypothetical protein
MQNSTFAIHINQILNNMKTNKLVKRGTVYGPPDAS